MLNKRTRKPEPTNEPVRQERFDT